MKLRSEPDVYVFAETLWLFGICRDRGSYAVSRGSFVDIGIENGLLFV